MRYEIQVYAYPKTSVSRFFARHLRLVERYFEDKTDSLTALTVSICRGLLGGTEVTESRHPPRGRKG